MHTRSLENIIQNDTYEATEGMQHTHSGSKDNLSLNMIRTKLQQL